MGRNGPVAEAVTNDQCEVAFNNIPVGTYHLKVSSGSVADTDSVITPSTALTDFEVKLKRPEDAAPGASLPTVSAVNLTVPDKARKEFDKANEFIAKQDFPRAIDRLTKAIAIYPNYADAYNNLGVVYARQGDRAREREVLQKAIGINDHFAAAYVNLGRMSISAGDFPGAEQALSKAASCDPTDAMTLVLLTYTEFMNHKFDEAIATSKHAHMLDGGHAFAHQVAARAYEQKHEAAAASAELELFLKEEPTGSRAEAARKELTALQAAGHPLVANHLRTQTTDVRP
jgi:Tfp pilus assembly protein PilF